MCADYFDENNYRKVNKQIIDLIKEKNPDWQRNEGFLADGVICPSEYAKQKVRVLCVLAESYGYDKMGDKKSIEEQRTEDVLGLGNRVRTVLSLSSLLWLIQKSIEQREMVKYDDMPWLFKKAEIRSLQDALSKIAWINVKKASRADGTRMVVQEVVDHARRNRAVLSAQIDAAAPHLMIICGTVVFRVLHEMELLGAEVSLGRIGQIQRVSRGPSVIEVSHPRNWWSYKGVHDLFEKIFADTESFEGKILQ